jgi:hypothetical protein
MKFAIRVLALVLVFAGAAAASVSSTDARTMPSRLSATGSLPRPDGFPGPVCSPGIPGCPKKVVSNPLAN